MRIGWTADLHLDKRLGHRTDERGVNQRSRDLEDALRQVIDGMIEQRLDACLFAGDLFDVAKPSERARQVLVREIQRLRAALPEAFIGLLRGNHDAPHSLLDATAVGTAGLALPGVVVADAYEPLIVTHADVAFSFVPWMRSDADFIAAIEALEPVPDKHNLLVLHCGMADLPEYAELRPGSQTLTRSLVPADRFDWIFSGHYHIHRTLPDLRWTFIGSPERLSANEIGAAKGWLLYDTDTAAITFMPLTVRAWRDLGTIDASGWSAERLTSFVSELAAEPEWSESIVRGRISNVPPDVLNTVDRIALNAAKAAAFSCDLEIRAADPVLDAAGSDDEGPLLDDIGEEWARHLAEAMADASDAERERTERLGLVALGKASADEPLIDVAA